MKSLHLILVSLFYLICFLLLTYPAWESFSIATIGNSGDELQALWNMWWVKKSLINDFASPYYTTYVHFPIGAPLITHPLALPHGLIYIALAPLFSLVEVYNLIVIAGFVFTGLSTYLLARSSSLSNTFSLVAGYLFTFSNYHFQHIYGHLEFISAQWLPLYFLFLFKVLNAPTFRHGLWLACVLFIMSISNYYYFLCAGISTIVILLWNSKQRHFLRLTKYPKFWLRWGFTVALCAFSSGLTVLALLISLAQYPILAGHDIHLGSLHLSELLLPGAYWRFSDLTRWSWSTLPAYQFEHSVALGFGVVLALFILVALGVLKEYPRSKVWAWIFLVFLTLSIGPEIYLRGEWIHYPSLYSILDLIFPFSKISGVPIRLFVMVVLAASFLTSLIVQELWHSKSAFSKFLAILIITVSLIETLPAAIPVTKPPELPAAYNSFSALLEPNQGVIDLSAPNTDLMYYQTQHQMPQAFGYLARLTKSADKQNRIIRRLLKKKKYDLLCNGFNFRLLILPTTKVLDQQYSYMLLDQDPRFVVYDLCAKHIAEGDQTLPLEKTIEY